jgi:hypothetical protein
VGDRIEFSPQTRQIVAARAGHRCSFPGCGKVTIGPDLPPDKFVQTGKTAHIFSAAPGGPRGQGGLSEQQLASPNNAIWLCDIHARVVDANRGVSYPPALLQSYKALQEAKASREFQGLHYPVSWFEELTIHESAVIEAGTKLRFGKLTLVIGPNFSGKSALCDWLAGFGDHRQLWRWLPRPQNAQVLDLELRYQQPESKRVRLQVNPSGTIGFKIGEQASPVQPFPMRFVFLREESGSKALDEMDDVELVCDRLNIDPLILPGLMPYVGGTDGLGFAKNLKFTEEVDRDEGAEPKITRRFRADVVGTSTGLWFRGLSHGEQVLVLLELAVALARFYSQQVPTMLILDRGMHQFPARFFAHLYEKLAAAEAAFQTIVVVPGEPSGMAELNWFGWTVARLVPGERPNGKTTIAQDPF